MAGSNPVSSPKKKQTGQLYPLQAKGNDLPKKYSHPVWNGKKCFLKIGSSGRKQSTENHVITFCIGPECALPSTNGKSSLVPCELNPRKGKVSLASFYLLAIKKASYSSFPRSISASVIKLKQDVLSMFKYQRY